MENNMKWNKLRLRPLNDEEKEYYKDSKIESVWDGNEPEIGEEVLVYSSQYEGVTTDIWTDDFDYGVGFENTDDTVIYWMSFPEPPRIVSTQKEGLDMKITDQEAINLIEELCRKEVERTGLPLVYDSKGTTKEKSDGQIIMYIHQRMTLDLDGFDSADLINQNTLVFEDGEWKTLFGDSFYGYELRIEQGDNYLTTFMHPSKNLTKEKLIKKLSSDEFKKIFDKHKELSKEMRELKESLNILLKKKGE